jgi:hypothetical protein
MNRSALFFAYLLECIGIVGGVYIILAFVLFGNLTDGTPYEEVGPALPYFIIALILVFIGHIWSKKLLKK